jgi:hypothetical protein
VCQPKVLEPRTAGTGCVKKDEKSLLLFEKDKSFFLFLPVTVFILGGGSGRDSPDDSGNQARHTV